MTPAIPGLDNLVLAGSGGFADVYRASQPRFDRVVAVKVLRTPVLDERVQSQFQQECAASGRLTGHPNILTVLQSGFVPTDGRPYIVMEWMEGGSLEERLAHGPMPAGEVLRIGVKICGALQTAHDAGVLHRDVKPANILVSGFGEPALADFGISSISAGSGMTSKLDALSPLYAAPEIIDGDRPTPLADVYALASTLYALLAGRAAFAGPEGEPMMSLVVRVLGEAPPPLSGTDIPSTASAAILAAMAKSPQDRPGSASALGELLRRAQEEAGDPPTEMVVRTAARTAPPSAPASSPVPAPPFAAASPVSAAAPVATAAVATPSDISLPERAAAHVGPTVARPRQEPEVLEPEPSGPSTGRRILVGAAAGALVALFLVGGFVFARARSPEPTTTTTATTTTTTTTVVPPPAPVLTEVKDLGATAQITWTDASASGTTHVVWHSPATPQDALTRVDPGKTSAEVKGLDPATGYCFKVGAVPSATQVSWSEHKCIRGAVMTGES